jgi:hypothetical protein
MKTRFSAAAVIAAFALLSMPPVSAHHSLNAEFDQDKTVTVKGVMTSIEWINPHIFFYVDVMENGTKATWAIETFPPNHMRSKYGLTKAVLGQGVIGTTREVTVELRPATSGKKLGWLEQITYPDGHSIKLAVDPGSPEAR